MNPQTIQTILFVVTLVGAAAAATRGWGSITATLATIRGDIRGLSRRIDRYTDATNLEISRLWEQTNQNTELVQKHQGRFEEMDR